MSSITILDEKEIKLADHLTELLVDDRYDTLVFIVAILPRKTAVAPSPQSIFKAFYYVNQTAAMGDFAKSLGTSSKILVVYLKGVSSIYTPRHPLT